MKFAVLIPHLHSNNNSASQLSFCLANLTIHEPDLLEHTFVILDPTGNKDEYEKTLTVTDKYGAHLVKKEERKGFSSIVNFGFVHCISNKYDAFALLNNDVEITAPFQSTCSDLFQAMPRLVVIGGLLLYPTGKIQAAGFHVPHQGVAREYDKSFRFGVEKGEYVQGRFVFGVTAAMQVIKSDSFLKIGTYHPGYKMGFEDVEFCYRTWNKGGHVLYTPRLMGVHHESATRGKVPSLWETMSYEKFYNDSGNWKLDEVRGKIEELNRQVLKEQTAKSQLTK